MPPLNEANTFSRIIYPYLEDLGYPERKSGYCFEQDMTKIKGSKHLKRFDAVFMVAPWRERPVLLVEAKAKDVKLKEQHVKQAQDYAFGERFAPVPPPFVLVSNGTEHRWFKRMELASGDFEYVRCDKVKWKDAKKAQAGGQYRTKLSIKRSIKMLKNVRRRIFEDLEDQYFPKGFDLKKSRLGKKERTCFEEILETQRCFVDPSLKHNEKSIKAILSSVALSWTLKILFLKILTDIGSKTKDEFPTKILKSIGSYGTSYPGIMRAAPYDGLHFSKGAEEWIFDQLVPVQMAEALLFEDSHNPIGDIWDGLVDSEEQDIQVKSLGNVYTPEPMVKAMVDCAERALGGWKDKKVLEPACGSGHFVRELYARMCKANLTKRIGNTDVVINAHKKTLADLRAVDVDPFATQTTQLGVFLELFGKPGVWRRIAPKGVFDLGKVVIKEDTLGDELDKTLKGFNPNLIIGNPPYGVSVTDDVKKKYKLGSPDSYGCFIARGIDLLPQNGHLIFVVSSSFLTTRTHRDLREIIVTTTAIKSIHVMHRNAFPKRDVFPAMLHLQRANDDEIKNNFYRFTDAWPIHPGDNDFLLALNNWATGEIKNKLPDFRFAEFEIPQSLLSMRITPPHANLVEEDLKESQKKAASLSILHGNEVVYPLVGENSTIYLMCSDKEYDGRVRRCTIHFPKLGEVDALEVKHQDVWIPFVKLWQIAQVRQGLATADDEYFLRKTPGVVANARRRNLKDVDLECTVTEAALRRLTKDEKINGIKVINPKRERYFIPYDKGGEQDTEAGEFRAFWSKIDYWIDWSEKSVNVLRKRASWPTGTHKKAYIRNEQYYFRKGIRFTRAGLYAPMFEINFEGVFSDKGSLIIPFSDEITEYLLAYLCSGFCRYLFKNFIQHGVMSEIDGIRQIPIPVPSSNQFCAIKALTETVIECRRNGKKDEPGEIKIDKKIQSLVKIDKTEQEEINTWFKRRYPHFGRGKNATKKSGKSTRRKARRT